MKKQRIKAKVADLVLNEGQLEWLPKNPRQWTREDVEKTRASLRRDPDFQEDSPLKVIEYEGKLLVFAGNLRTASAKEEKWKTFESILYTPENEEDRETIKRRAILDNGSFGSWDYDALANEWDDLPLSDWGLPSWIGEHDDDLLESLGGLSVESVAKAGESETGLSSITFVFSIEDAEIVKGWIDENTKEMLTNKIVEICQPVEAK